MGPSPWPRAPKPPWMAPRPRSHRRWFRPRPAEWWRWPMCATPGASGQFATIWDCMGNRVSLFVTCIVDQLFPKVGMAMAGVLERLGYRVDFPEDQTCCGQPAFNSGYRAEARIVARYFLDTFETSECIVVPSGSCTAMVSHHFAELFRKEPQTLERVHALEKRIFEFSTFLTEIARVEDVGARLDDVVTF